MGVQLPQDRHITYQNQFRKCGKSHCKTCQEGKGHGPYWFGYTRVNGILKSYYIGKNISEPIRDRQKGVEACQ